MADVYRMLVVVDVLDGSSPAAIVRNMTYRHGPVIGWGIIGENSAPVDYDQEVLKEDETTGAEATRRLGTGPADGPSGRWMDG